MRHARPHLTHLLAALAHTRAGNFFTARRESHPPPPICRKVPPPYTPVDQETDFWIRWLSHPDRTPEPAWELAAFLIPFRRDLVPGAEVRLNFWCTAKGQLVPPLTARNQLLTSWAVAWSLEPYSAFAQVQLTWPDGQTSLVTAVADLEP